MNIVIFFCYFFMGNNFCDLLFAPLDDTDFPKLGPLLKERICSKWSKFFPFRVDPYEKEGNNKVINLLPLKVYHSPLDSLLPTPSVSNIFLAWRSACMARHRDSNLLILLIKTVFSLSYLVF